MSFVTPPEAFAVRATLPQDWSEVVELFRFDMLAEPCPVCGAAIEYKCYRLHDDGHTETLAFVHDQRAALYLWERDIAAV